LAESGPLPPAAGGDSRVEPLAGGGDHEVALRELLRSPLDEEPRRRRRTDTRRWVTPFLFIAAVAAGAGGVLAAAALTGAGEPPATTTAAATTTAPVPIGPALPAGYSPLGEGYGARVERVLLRPDAAFVTLSLAVDENHDPAETLGHQGGQWALEFPDGTTVRSTGVAFDPVARAAFTIAFPPLEQDPSGAVLQLLMSAELHSETFTAAAAGTMAVLPAEGAFGFSVNPSTFRLEGGGTLHLGSLFLEVGGGSLSWTLEGAGIAAHIDPSVVLEGAATTVMLLPNDPFWDFRNRMLSNPPPDLGLSGEVALQPLDLTTTDPGPDFTVTVSFVVTWATTTGAEAAIPIGNAVITEVGGLG
jgi:hypothetical protein